MGLRTQALILGVVLTCCSSFATALGLGEIKLNSSLNQPLDAEIRLLQLRGLSEGEILVGLASADAFADANVGRNIFLLDIEFDLDLNAPGGPVVRLTSERLVREPFLNFIVEAQWPSGRLLREYTVLVDLPVFSGSQAEQVSPAQETAQQPQTTPAPATPRPQAPRQPSGSEADTYGPVAANDNLWRIARQVRPDPSVSVQQTMLAIQRLNPQAFINDNINLLRRGQVLRLPDVEDINQLTNRDAIAQVAEQNKTWRQGGEFEQAAAQVEGGKTFTETDRDGATTGEGRVKLSSDSNATGQGLGAEGEGESLSSELAVTQEELDAATRENSDLRSRIRAMEEQIETMERLVEVSSEEMRALELASQQATQEAEQAEAPTDETGAESEPEAAASETDTQPQQVDETATDESPAQPAQAVAPQKPEKTLLDMALDNLMYILIGLGALVVLIGLLVWWRNRSDSFDDEDFEEFESDFQPLEQDSDFNADHQPDDDTVVMSDDRVENDLYESETDIPAEAETEDVVAESDIHIAYGQYDQAEEKLKRALEREPNNAAIHLKLLEVYVATQDGHSFDSQYARLRGLGNQDAIARAAVMRESIDGMEPFDESAFAASTEDLDSTGDDDTVVNYDEEAASSSDYSLDDDTLHFSSNNEEATADTLRDDDVFEVDETEEPEPFAAESFDEQETGSADEPLEFELTDDDETQLTSEDDTVPMGFDQGDDNREAFAESSEATNFDEQALSSAGDASLEFDESELQDLDFDLLDDDSDSGEDDTQVQSPSDIEASFEDWSAEDQESPSEPSLDSGSSLADTEDDNTRALEPVEEGEVIGEADSLDFDLEPSQDREFAPEEPLAEEASPSSESAINEDDLADLEFDFADLGGEEDNTSTGSAGTDYSERAEELEDQTVAFDLGESAEADAASEPQLTDETLESSAEEGDFDFGDFDNLDEFETEIEPVPSASATEDTDEELIGADASESDGILNKAIEDEFDTLGDFDSEMDLDGDINLDDLDQELDALSSGFDSNDELSELGEADQEQTETGFDSLEPTPPPTDTESPEEVVQANEAELKDDFESLAAEPVEPQAQEEPEPADVPPHESIEPESPSLEDETEVESAAFVNDFEIPDFDPEEDDDSSLGFLSDSDETATKLDLARAYIDMGDSDGAKDILDEILEEGTDDQKKDAETLLSRLG